MPQWARCFANRHRNLLRLTNNACVMVAVISCMLLLPSALRHAERPAPSVQIVNTAGVKIPRLFIDVSMQSPTETPRNRFSWLPCGIRKAYADLKGELFGQTAHAQSCSESNCSGHYMLDAGPFCGGGGCGYSYYSKYYSRSDLGASYSEGYKYTGYTDCQGCTCEETSCYNP
jgi:hypothetical protein